VSARDAHPLLKIEQLVGGGHGVCLLRESKGGRVMGAEVRVPGGGREAGYEAAAVA
jgi:hypothetical protein